MNAVDGWEERKTPSPRGLSDFFTNETTKWKNTTVQYTWCVIGDVPMCIQEEADDA